MVNRIPHRPQRRRRTLADFAALPNLIATHARARPDGTALIGAGQRIDYRALDAAMDRVARRCSVTARSPVTRSRSARWRIRPTWCCSWVRCARVSRWRRWHRAARRAQIAGMTADSGAKHLFLDARMRRPCPPS